MTGEGPRYDLAAVRALLLAAFDAEELGRFCQERPAFSPLVQRFGPGHGLDDRVDEVVEYCQSRALLGRLLVELRGERPRTYARFAQELEIPAEALPEVACPYRGLEPFEAEHAEFYFGREAMIERLLDAVVEHSFVAVVGPSGCGKSSLVRAGLVTRLRGGALPGSQDWALRVLRPGADPLRALCAPLAELLEPEASSVDRVLETRKLADALRAGELDIRDVVASLPQRGIPRLVLIADQFEELYTECMDEALQRAFVQALLSAAGEDNVSVVLTLRADFYGHVLADRALGEAVDRGLVNVLPMSEEELVDAVEQPALRSGRTFEPGLVERIVEDVAGQPGNLPLLQFALTELWGRQTEGGLLTHEAYELIGEVGGAIARRAEAVYGELERQGQGEVVQRIFLRLTHYGQDVAGTRRRAALDELVTPRTPRGEVEAALKALADARLLVTGREELQEAATAEVSHEALIGGWDRLRRWLDEDRAFGLWREKLAGARRTWVETGQDEGALLRGATLSEAEGWLSERGDELNERERVFVEASLALRAREEAQRIRTRRRLLAAAAAVALLIVGMSIAFALIQRNQAQVQRGLADTAEAGATDLAAEVGVRSTAQAEVGRQANALSTEVVVRSTAEAEIGLQANALSTEVVRRSTAEVEAQEGEATAVALAIAEAAARAEADEQRQLALSRQLAAQAINEFNNSNWALGILLAIEAGRKRETAEAYAALREAFARPGRTRLVLPGQSAWLNQAVWNADETRILSAGCEEQDEDGQCLDGTAWVSDAGTGRVLLKLAGHTGPVLQASWNGPETRILTASTDGTARVWDAATGEELLALTGHTNWILEAVWNADSTRILTASQDGTARVWDADTGEALFILSSHSDAVSHTSWNADESLILTASEDGTARVWVAKTGEELGALPGLRACWSVDGTRILTAGMDGYGYVWLLPDKPSREEGPEVLVSIFSYAGPFWYVAWNADGSRILTTGWDGPVRVWDSETGEELLVLSGHTDLVTQAVWNDDETRILTASNDGTARVWDARTGQELFRLQDHTDVIRQAGWNRDGSLILTASGDGMARVWEAESGSELPVLTGYEGHLSDDESRIVTEIGLGTAVVWDTASGQELVVLSGHTDYLTEVVWNADGSRILTASRDGTARVWDSETGEELFVLPGHKDWIGHAVWNADESRILTASDDTVRVWDAETGQELLNLSGLTERSLWVAWSTDGARILTANGDDTVRMWSAETGEELLALSSPGSQFTDVTWNADGTRVLARGCESVDDSGQCVTGAVHVWDLETGEQILSLDGHAGWVSQAVWNADESHILTASYDGTVRVWDASTAEELLAVRGSDAEWSADESRLLTSGDGMTRVWDSGTGELLLTVPGGDAWWNADESRILTTSWDGKSQVWDAETGQEVFSLFGHTDEGSQVAWNSDGSRIVTAAYDDTVRLWYTQMDDLLAEACRRVTRNMTAEEWQHYLGNEPYQETCPGKPVPGRDF